MRGARTVADLRALFDSAAMAAHYGEALSVRDHMLQCAAAAVAGRLPDTLIVAALFHDIGWALGEPHETAGATWLAPLFPRDVTEPIRWHVAAKRYLVAREPGYRAGLSPQSVLTLEHQGGPMSVAEAERFEANPWFGAAVTLRRIDDGGKAIAPPTIALTDLLTIVHRLTL